MTSNDPLAIAAIETIGRPVADRIDALLAEELARWSTLHGSLNEPLQSLRQLVMAGGKRLRPAFCYWMYVGAGGDPLDTRVVDTGAALELLHSFALVHDDVMDDSRQRRGNPAVHTQFEDIHQSSGLTGESRRFGEGVAILVGDMAFVYADFLMRGAPRVAADVFTELRIELNVGQYLDLWATARSEASLEMAQLIATYKSGKYTVERPMHLGAALAERYEELAEPISGYGVPVGEAFQMRDDILGAFGDSHLLGKPVGGDLREGKPTALLAIARQRASGEDGKFLRARYGAHDLTESEIADLQAILRNTGAESDVESIIDNLVEKGLKSLEAMAITDDARERLVRLAYFVAGREN